jgi:hypothetical protein
MFYDPDCSRVSLLDQWIAWLETKDPDEYYDWYSVGARGCACGQFYGSAEWATRSGIDVRSGNWSLLNKIARGEPRDDCVHRFCDRGNWTFGKCLERAKAYRDNKHLGWHAR